MICNVTRILTLITCLALALSSPGQAQVEVLTLEDSVQIALQNNPTVRIARENIQKSKAVVDEATAIGMPKLMVEGTYTRVDEVPVASFGDAEIKLGSAETRTADLILVQPIDVFGAIKTGKRIANLNKSTSQYQLEQAINDITLEAKTAYYNVLRAQKFVDVQKDTIAQLEAHLKDAKHHYDAGTIARFDVLRAETQLANAQQGFIAAENGVSLAKSALNNVLGRPLDTAFKVAEPETPEFYRFELATCTDSASRWRPEALLAEEYVQMSEMATKANRLSGKPRFNLQWVYNRNFDTTIFSPREGAWRAMITTSYSLYDGGVTQASVKKAISDENNARSTQTRVIQGVTLDAQQSYLNVNESQDRIRAAEKGLEQGREAMRLAQVRYKGEVSTQVEVMDAQAALTLAETNYVNALYDYQVALAKLERAVGGREHMARLIQQASGQSVALEQ